MVTNANAKLFDDRPVIHQRINFPKNHIIASNFFSILAAYSLQTRFFRLSVSLSLFLLLSVIFFFPLTYTYEVLTLHFQCRLYNESLEIRPIPLLHLFRLLHHHPSEVSPYRSTTRCIIATKAIVTIRRSPPQVFTALSLAPRVKNARNSCEKLN